MTGYIENNRVYVDLPVYGVSIDLKRTIKIQVDTGFDGHLQLPFNEAISLGLILRGTQPYTLADGNVHHVLICLGNIEIDGKPHFTPIDISSTGTTLLGQAFLKQVGVVMSVDYANDKVTFTVAKKAPPRPTN